MKLGTARLVDESIEKRCKSQTPRDYLGASILGTECDRQLWYQFHHPKPVDDPRVQRIFDLGNILEDYMIKLLKESGIEVWDVDADGEQFGFIDEEVAGHCDGVAQGFPESTVPHLLEFKSANVTS